MNVGTACRTENTQPKGLAGGAWAASALRWVRLLSGCSRCSLQHHCSFLLHKAALALCTHLSPLPLRPPWVCLLACCRNNPGASAGTCSVTPSCAVGPLSWLPHLSWLRPEPWCGAGRASCVTARCKTFHVQLLLIKPANKVLPQFSFCPDPLCIFLP